jgi:hypothetical protein
MVTINMKAPKKMVNGTIPIVTVATKSKFIR